MLEQLSPVRSFQWDPQQPRLAICTGGNKVYLWSPAGCVSVQVPGEGECGVPLSSSWPAAGGTPADGHSLARLCYCLDCEARSWSVSSGKRHRQSPACTPWHGPGARSVSRL